MNRLINISTRRDNGGGGRAVQSDAVVGVLGIIQSTIDDE